MPAITRILEGCLLLPELCDQADEDQWRTCYLTQDFFCFVLFILLFIWSQLKSNSFRVRHCAVKPERTCDATRTHRWSTNTNGARWKFVYCSFKHHASISAWLRRNRLPDLFPDSRRGSRQCQTSVCTSTKPVSFPLVAFFARRYSNAGAIIGRPASAFSVPPRNWSVVWSAPRLSLISPRCCCRLKSGQFRNSCCITRHTTTPMSSLSWRGPPRVPSQRRPGTNTNGNQHRRSSEPRTGESPSRLLSPATANPSVGSEMRLCGSSHTAWAEARSKVASSSVTQMFELSLLFCFRYPSGNKRTSYPGSRRVSSCISFLFSAFSFYSWNLANHCYTKQQALASRCYVFNGSCQREKVFKASKIL